MKKPMTWDRGGTSGTPPIGCNAWGKGGGDRREVDPGDSPQGIRGGIRIGTAPALCDGAVPLGGWRVRKHRGGGSSGGADQDVMKARLACRFLPAGKMKAAL